MQTWPKDKPTFRRLLGISFVTVLLTLFSIELVVRAVPLYPADLSEFDNQVGMVYVPGAEGVHFNPSCWADFRQEVWINSKGLRDDETSYERSTIPRVLFLGDSFLAALEVPLEATFHTLLQDKLGIEVVAGGHGGWGTDNELLWYRSEGYRYQPDVVILLLQPGNDVQDNSTTINHVPNQIPYFMLQNGIPVLHLTAENLADVEDAGSLAHRFLLQYSRLYGLTIYRLRALQLRHNPAPGAVGDMDEADARSGTYTELYEEAFDLTFSLIAQLRDEVERDGARFAVAVASSDRNLILGEDNGRFLEALDTLRIPRLDLLPAILAAHSSESPMHFPCDGHWTPAGHAVVAEVLSAFLMDPVNELWRPE